MMKYIKKITYCLLAVSILIACSAQVDNETINETKAKVFELDEKYVNDFLTQIDKSKLVKLKSRDSKIEDCESIVFGKYEVDGNLNNGLEDIEWVLIDIDENNNEAILLSKYVLDYKAYLDAAYALKNKYEELNDIYNSDEYYDWINSRPIEEIRTDMANIYGEMSEKISWETSTLRQWLNNEFYDTAFSKNEKSIIKNKELVSKKFDTDYKTIDKVFCIDVNDLVKYFNCDESFNESYRARERLYYTKSTKFATKILEATEELSSKTSKDAHSNYWFRSMNTMDVYTSMMQNAGLLFFMPISHKEKCTANVESRDIGVRPAICVDLDMLTIKERSKVIKDDFENKIKFDKRMFKEEESKNINETEVIDENVEYYYTGGEWQ